MWIIVIGLFLYFFSFSSTLIGSIILYNISSIFLPKKQRNESTVTFLGKHKIEKNLFFKQPKPMSWFPKKMFFNFVLF